MAGLSVKTTVQGVEDLVRKLANLSRSASGRIARKAMTKGAQVVARVAKSEAPKGPTGTLRRSIGYRVKTFPSGVTVAVIGARTGFRTVHFGRAVDPSRYAHLVEGGRKAVKAIKKLALSEGPGGKVFGKSAGPVTGTLFLKRTEASTKGPVQAEVAKVLGEEIEKAGKGSGE